MFPDGVTDQPNLPLFDKTAIDDGIENKELATQDSVMISIWDVSG